MYISTQRFFSPDIAPLLAYITPSIRSPNSTQNFLALGNYFSCYFNADLLFYFFVFP